MKRSSSWYLPGCLWIFIINYMTASYLPRRLEDEGEIEEREDEPIKNEERKMRSYQRLNGMKG